MRTLTAPIGLAVLLAFAACGGGDDEGGVGHPFSANGDGASGGDEQDGGDGNGDTGAPGGDGEGTQAALEDAARESFAFYLAGDLHSYYQTVARPCREKAGWSGVSEDARSRRAAASRLQGLDLDSVTVSEVVITGFDGSTASVTLNLAGTGDTRFREARANPWVFDGDAWRWADCSDFMPRGGGFPESSKDQPLERGFVARVGGWFVFVRGVEPKEDEFLMGEPGMEPPDAGQQYFRVSVSTSYDGAEASAVLGDDLEFSLVAGGTEYAEDASCGPVPGLLALTGTSLPGEDRPGYVCRVVASNDAGGLLLRVRAKDGGGEAWLSLEGY